MLTHRRLTARRVATTLLLMLSLYAYSVIDGHAARAEAVETVLYTFNNNGPGEDPIVPLIETPGAAFYGATIDGVFYSITSSGSYSLLYNSGYLSVAVGHPEALTLAPDGTIYGVSRQGGTSGDGSIFKIAPSGAQTLLHSFNGGTDGAFPETALIIGHDGLLYGTTEGDFSGTDGSRGTIYSINTDGTGYMVQYRFQDSNYSTDGAFPENPLSLASGSTLMLYGMNSGGGSTGQGTLFALTPGTTDGGAIYHVLHTFHDGSVPNDGEEPQFCRLLVDNSGNLYGTTPGGGQPAPGTLFKFSLASNTETILHNFGAGYDGEEPTGGLLLASDGNLYGVTQGGGADYYGTVYEISPDASSYNIIYNFGDGGEYDGDTPTTLPVEDSDGDLIGTTNDDGPFSGGTVYKLAVGLPDPVNIGSLAVAPTSVTAGSSNAVGTITLNMPAPSAGATVTLQSSNTAVTIPATVAITAGSETATFPITTNAVASATNVTINAVYNNSIAYGYLTVTPAAASGSSLRQVTLSPISVQGGTASTTANRVYLTTAPSASVSVALTSSNTAVATVPATLTINSGATSHTFTITTKAVTTTQTVTITAKYNGSTQTATLTVTPPPAAGLKSVVLSPTSTVGGSAATTANRVYWTGNAPANETVTLSSSNTAVATVPSSATISSGSSSHTFAITTKAVTAQQAVTITATSGGVTQTATLTVTP